VNSTGSPPGGTRELLGSTRCPRSVKNSTNVCVVSVTFMAWIRSWLQGPGRDRWHGHDRNATQRTGEPFPVASVCGRWGQAAATGELVARAALVRLTFMILNDRRGGSAAQRLIRQPGAPGAAPAPPWRPRPPAGGRGPSRTPGPGKGPQ